MANTGPLLHNIQSLSDNRSVFQTVSNSFPLQGLFSHLRTEYHFQAQMFSLQILHRNISFTAAGFFNLDYKLITSVWELPILGIQRITSFIFYLLQIVAAVTTYLVIIIQFHLANQQSLNLAAAGSRLNLTSNWELRMPRQLKNCVDFKLFNMLESENIIVQWFQVNMLCCIKFFINVLEVFAEFLLKGSLPANN